MKMSRRDTILVAVLMNAGLLAILFATAIEPDSARKKQSSDQIYVLEASEEHVKSDKNDFERIETLIEENIFANDEIETHDRLEQSLESALPMKQKDFVTVTVKRGESLDKLSRRYGTSISAISKLNGLASTQLSIGQVLKIPSQSVSTNTAMLDDIELPGGKKGEYVIQSGDNPWLIAKKNGIKLQKLLEVNGLDTQSAKTLRPGMILVIPSNP